MAGATPRSKSGELREMLAVLRPWRAGFITALFQQALSMAFGLMFPWLVGMLVDTALPSVKAAPNRWHFTLNELALLLLCTLGAQAVLTFFYSLTFQTIGQRAVNGLRKRLHALLISLPMRFHAEHRVGELTSRLGSDMALMEDFYCSAVPQAIRQGALFLGGLVAIFLTSPRLTGLMLISFPVFIAVAVFFGRAVRKIWRTAQDRLAAANIIADETLQNIASVKAFGNEPFEQRRYGGALEEFLATVLRGARFRAGLIAFIILGIFGSMVLVMWYGARLMQAGELTHGELLQFTLYSLFVGGGVSSIAEVISAFQKCVGASTRIRELLAETPEPLLESPRPFAGAASVEMEDVHFRYPSRPDIAVLRGISLRAKAGERIAIVGSSGAGKSTIVSLLLRFYEPDAGRILFNSHDAREADLPSLRARLAIVPQEVLLFGGTIRDNIAYGLPAATDAEIHHAAQRANCAAFIESFPEQYATRVGERGVKLSGGQRQRIAIARAFLRNPELLLLDEATSSLDSESEHLIQQALDELLTGRTAIIIAHRLATVRKCDRIYVIEAGRVTESGTHEELIAKEAGTYRRLAEMQFTAGA